MSVPNLPADEAVGDPVVGVPIGGKAEVGGFVDEQLEVGDGETDQRCASRNCEQARHSHRGDDSSKGQIAQGDVPANRSVVRRQPIAIFRIIAARLRIDPGTNALEVLRIEDGRFEALVVHDCRRTASW